MVKTPQGPAVRSASRPRLQSARGLRGAGLAEECQQDGTAVEEDSPPDVPSSAPSHPVFGFFRLLSLGGIAASENFQSAPARGDLAWPRLGAATPPPPSARRDVPARNARSSPPRSPVSAVAKGDWLRAVCPLRRRRTHPASCLSPFACPARPAFRELPGISGCTRTSER